VQALLDALQDSPVARIARVVSNRGDAPALERARRAGVPVQVLADPADPAELVRAAGDARLVVLAGYLKRVPPAAVARFRWRLINIHPALLPAFGGDGMYGRRVHEAVLASGAALSGATVHYVDEEYDRGPILAQWPVPVRGDDTPDSLLALLAGSTRDRTGNVTLTLGQGAPKRLLQCPLDEVGYVVGNITGEGYLLLRRVGARTTYPLFDQQLEGHRVTVFGSKGPIPGVVAVKSTHLTRGRVATGAPDPVSTVDNAYVDVGAATATDARALGIDVLAPLSLAKQPLLYGDRLLAGPAAGRRAACAALVAAVQAKPKVRGAVVVAFTVQSLYASNSGLASVKALLGPFEDIKTASVPTRYTDTAVETVALADVNKLEHEMVQWMEGR